MKCDWKAGTWSACSAEATHKVIRTAGTDHYCEKHLAKLDPPVEAKPL